MEFKTCYKCKEEKSLDDFYSYKGKIHAPCKSCKKRNAKICRIANKQKLNGIYLESKQCSRCKTTLPAMYFYRNRNFSDGMQPWCKKCQIETTTSARNDEARRKKFLYDQNRWELKNKELLFKDKERVDKIRNDPAFKLARYKANLKYKFGISYEKYEEIIKEQNNLCAICKRSNPSKHRKLHVDHDHKTGSIRALLCIKCNAMLGSANDSIQILNSAIDYLKKYNEN